VANLAKGRDSLFAASADAMKTIADLNIRKPFFLYVGNAYPHKNLEGLLRAFKRLVGEEGNNWRLVLVGKEDYFYAQLKNYAAGLGLYAEEGKDNPVIFPGYVPDKELEILYKEAIAYIFPSFYEGFGLPPLEAMAKGCPVISSNRTSLPEVLGDAALYFDPSKEEEIAAKAKGVAADDELRIELIRRGYERAKKYSWWECGRQTWEIYNDILTGKN
jgi:glycosyltransferase involved in cell wall biosynthesis